MKNILITGGSGLIGSHLALKLQDRGYGVTIYDINPPPDEEFNYIKGDIMDYELLEVSVKQHDTVCHLAAMVGVVACLSSKEEVYRINFDGVKNIIKACTENNVEHLLFASSSEVYGNGSKDTLFDELIKLNPITHYGKAKMASEELLKTFAQESETKVTVLRYCNIYGPRQSIEFVIPVFIDNTIKGTPLPICGNGESIRNFTYIDDAVEGTICALIRKDKNYDIFNISSSETIKIKDLADNIIKIKGNGSVKYVSYEDINRQEKQEILIRIPSTKKSEDILKFKAQTPIDEGLRKTYNFYLNNKI